MLRLSGAVDDAAHDSYFHHFDSGIDRLPGRHLLAQITLDLVCHVLEIGRRCSAAAGAGYYLRGEGADLEGLEDLLADEDFFCSVAIGERSERGADGVTDAFLQEDAEGGCGVAYAFGTEAGLGEAEVQRVVATGG